MLHPRATENFFHPTRHMKAVAALVLCCTFWGISFPVIKAVMIELRETTPDASTLFFSSWIQLSRFLVAAVLILLLTLRIPFPNKLEIRQGLTLAFWGGIGMWLQADGLAYTHASTSAFLTQSYCVLLPLWAALRHKRPPEKSTVLAVIFVMAGGAILAGISMDKLTLGRGEIATIASAVFFTFQILALEKPEYSDNRGRSVTLVMCAGITIIFLPITLATAPSPGVITHLLTSGSILVLVTVLSIICTIGSFWLMNTWQRHVTATEAGLIYTTEPVFAACYALFLPGILASLMGHPYANESLTVRLIIGGIFILTANLIVLHSMKKREPVHKSPVT